VPARAPFTRGARLLILVRCADPVRTIRFPYYEAAGHAVTIRQSAELLADVAAWLRVEPGS
jgi:hypothetical protein